ncbi:hypothetical protein BJ508DRAFT_309760 [Ascobolus immersus RN42]|uniref:Uncharacterized protein n=1 Tax=Ascobolus immersus RN42 TaxID=1160509 RepID=A0A3N4I803_ASCIM|nr:hypothetical protein BJ508DRAFT_309760 [Ascobolus immersus RN42]
MPSSSRSRNARRNRSKTPVNGPVPIVDGDKKAAAAAVSAPKPNRPPGNRDNIYSVEDGEPKVTQWTKSTTVRIPIGASLTRVKNENSTSGFGDKNSKANMPDSLKQQPAHSPKLKVEVKARITRSMMTVDLTATDSEDEPDASASNPKSTQIKKEPIQKPEKWSSRYNFGNLDPSPSEHEHSSVKHETDNQTDHGWSSRYKLQNLGSSSLYPARDINEVKQQLRDNANSAPKRRFPGIGYDKRGKRHSNTTNSVGCQGTVVKNQRPDPVTVKDKLAHVPEIDKADEEDQEEELMIDRLRQYVHPGPRSPPLKFKSNSSKTPGTFVDERMSSYARYSCDSVFRHRGEVEACCKSLSSFSLHLFYTRATQHPLLPKEDGANRRHHRAEYPMISTSHRSEHITNPRSIVDQVYSRPANPALSGNVRVPDLGEKCNILQDYSINMTKELFLVKKTTFTDIMGVVEETGMDILGHLLVKGTQRDHIIYLINSGHDVEVTFLKCSGHLPLLKNIHFFKVYYNVTQICSIRLNTLSRSEGADTRIRRLMAETVKLADGRV